MLFIRKHFLPLLLLIVFVAILVYFYYSELEGNTVYYTIGWITLIILLLWLGNSLITRQLDRWFPWLRFGRKRFFIHLFIGIFYSVGIINLAYYLFKILFTQDPPTTEQLIVSNVFGGIIFIPAFSMYFSLQFLNHWRESEVELEKFQKESMRSQLSSLKNHLDPHFLFNNLNILSSLIDKSKDMSQEFLVRFAQVYRTMLHTKVEDLIPLEEEMEFIKSYIYLIKTRFEENIRFEINLDDDASFYMLPPLTIQMLLENAVKHNIITETRPLEIRIVNDGHRLKVINSLYEKPEDIKSKSGTGIKNIRERLRYFTDEELTLEKNKHEFIVTLPLIEIETI